MIPADEGAEALPPELERRLSEHLLPAARELLLGRPALAESLGRVLARGEITLGPEVKTTGFARAVALLRVPGAPAEALLADPRDLVAVAADQPPAEPEPGASLDELRIYRRRLTLALAARELTGELAAPEAATILSVAADALIQHTLNHARQRVSARLSAASEVSLGVLALGKLGGAELNYSSDVDLVLFRADDAPRVAAEAVARELVRELQQASAQGRLFRVDLRLRPYGRTGELIPRRSAVVEYHRGRGRTWERQAWIKARPVGGDLALGRALLDELAPILWRETLEARAIQEIVALREEIVIHTELAERDVKAGPGGLRDVEFAVQFLQLLHGGGRPALRESGTLAAIEALAKAQILRDDETPALREVYAFLRKLEHLLQLVHDREATRLPLPGSAGSDALAACLQIEPEVLEERFLATQTRARALLDHLLHRPFAATASGGLDLQDLLLAKAPDPRAGAAYLAGRGFRHPEAAWRHLEGLSREPSLLLSPSGRARTVLAGLAPRLIEGVTRHPEPDRTLRHLVRALAPLGAKATVFQLLAEAPDLLELLTALAAGSGVLSELLANHPDVFDEVVDRLLTNAPIHRDDIEAAARGASPRALRGLKALYLLQIAMPDLAGRANLQNTARKLADLSEGLLRAFVGQVTDEVAELHGGRPPGTLVGLALGQLGGRELAYASDCDIVFVYTESGPAPDGTGPAFFWGEVVQRALALGESVASSEGPLLAIDLRLRPGGSKAPLAQAWSSARDYYLGQGPGDGAHPFERLALHKARPVTGDPASAATLAAELRGLLYGLDTWESLRDEVAHMRERQIAQADPGDLKRARGGLSTIELGTAALALAHGAERPALHEANTAHLLDALEREGLLDPRWHRALRTAYGYLRRAILRLRALTWHPSPIVPPGEGARPLALGLGYQDVGRHSAQVHFRRELDFYRGEVAAWLAELVVESDCVKETP